MNILVFDKITRKYKGNISEIASLIWTERYWECGDFELETPLVHRIISLVEMDDYFKIAYSNTTMVVEEIEITSPTNSSGGKIKIKGRSLESILDRRILWSDYQRSAPVKTYIPELINLCFTDPSNGEGRVVDYLTVKDASDITNEDEDKIEVDASRGDDLYSIVSSSTLASEIGFRIEFNQVSGEMVFSLYEGEDKTNLHFSEQNLILQDANLYRSKESLKNIALVGGEGEGKKRKMVVVTQGEEEPTALQRRELWVDARDVQKEDGENNTKYNNRLTLRGVEKLEEHVETITAEGKLINLGRYKIREDFNLGDLVTIQNQFFTAKSRITEIIQSWDSSDGYTIYPGFITKEVQYRSEDITEPEYEIHQPDGLVNLNIDFVSIENSKTSFKISLDNSEKEIKNLFTRLDGSSKGLGVVNIYGDDALLSTIDLNGISPGTDLADSNIIYYLDYYNKIDIEYILNGVFDSNETYVDPGVKIILNSIPNESIDNIIMLTKKNSIIKGTYTCYGDDINVSRNGFAISYNTMYSNYKNTIKAKVKIEGIDSQTMLPTTSEELLKYKGTCIRNCRIYSHKNYGGRTTAIINKYIASYNSSYFSDINSELAPKNVLYSDSDYKQITSEANGNSTGSGDIYFYLEEQAALSESQEYKKVTNSLKFEIDYLNTTK